MRFIRDVVCISTVHFFLLLSCIALYEYSTIHVPTVWPSHFTPRYLFKRNEIICPNTYLYTNVLKILLCISHRLETIKMSINIWFLLKGSYNELRHSLFSILEEIVLNWYSFLLYMFCRIHSRAIWPWNFLCRKILTEISLDIGLFRLSVSCWVSLDS